jgi:hypothetical protein
METNRCPECGSTWTDSADGNSPTTCEEHFHQMLFWEAENPAYGVVHHLMVLCYHLQHPSLYSPDGLTTAKQLLVGFLEHGLTTEETRRRNRAALDSGVRKFKIKGAPDSHGVYDRPIQWTMTAADVTTGGADHYSDNVRGWARSVYDALVASGNLAPA